MTLLARNTRPVLAVSARGNTADRHDDWSTVRGERIGRQLAAPRLRRARSCVGVALLLGAGWLGVANRPAIDSWSVVLMERLRHASRDVGTNAVSQPDTQRPALEQPLPIGTTTAAASNAAEVGSTPDAASPDIINAAPSEPPPSANPQSPAGSTAYAAPQQTRATAAGLHPDLSPAVLARLSPGDLRNAAAAIDKALAGTPDDGSLTWPRTREPGQAMFTVHFVAGAGPNCRRYVVIITKDGWSTTALPMERCGDFRKLKM